MSAVAKSTDSEGRIGDVWKGMGYALDKEAGIGGDGRLISSA